MGKKEESVLDYIIVNSLVAPYVEEMEIDESKAKALTRFKKGTSVPSDHDYLSCNYIQYSSTQANHPETGSLLLEE